MAYIVGAPKFQAFDNNGDPLSGGKVYSYIGGSATPKATYPTLADAEASTNANTNPVVLDSRGEANIVVSGGTKLILTTSTGSPDSPIWSVDNIGTSQNDITDANGNEILTFSPVAIAVNNFNMANAVTGTPPILSTEGNDANIGMRITTKGSGLLELIGPTIAMTGATSILGAVAITGNTAITGSATVSTTLGVTGAATLAGTNILSGLTYPVADGTVGQSLSSSASGTLAFRSKIGSVVQQILTATGTYTPTTGTLMATFVLVGGGGGGGGAAAGGAQRGIGAGGGSGGIARKLVTIAGIGANAVVTIGAAGAAGAAGATGGTGGTTSIVFAGSGGTIAAIGGSGGLSVGNYSGSSGSVGANGGAGGATSGGDASSSTGDNGFAAVDPTAAGVVVTGSGASNPYGAGSRSPAIVVTTNGSSGAGYGSGGSGAFCTASTTATGGLGAPGLIIVTEYLGV